MSDDSLTASQKFEAEAHRWEETGELQWSGKNEYAFTKLNCWLMSPGADSDGVSNRLQRYFVAAKTAFAAQGPDWFERFLMTRDYCSVCGETYRLDNLSFCTHCDALLGYCHRSVGEKGPNGNYRCPSCKIGEIVG